MHFASPGPDPMAIVDDMERTGQWLFRWRGYLPLAVLGLSVIAVLVDHPRPGHAQARGAWEMVCLMISGVGLAFRVMTVGHAPAGTSGRNARRQVATTLNTTGMYSLLRHPLYLGNFFLMLGVVLFAKTLWLTIWYALSFWIYYERIMAAEEAFLRRQFGPAFESWSRAVPAFVPRFSGWIAPSLSFSIRNVLRREYNGFFAIFLSMFILDVARNAAWNGHVAADSRWLFLLGTATAIWLVLRSLKRHTTALRVSVR